MALNPRLLGAQLLDETGCVAPAKLLWSARAWAQLFGRAASAVCDMTEEECAAFEERVAWMRIHLVVGWAGEGEGEACTGGRLGVLGVMM